MAFLAKGPDVILKPGSGSGTSSFLFKRLNEDGTWSDATWGSGATDFVTPISSSVWTTFGNYKYQSVGLTRQVYLEPHQFNRNVRFDSKVILSNDVTPAGSDLSNIFYLTAAVRGALTDGADTICQRVIDEFLSGSYTYVLALGTLQRDIEDYRAVNVNVNNIKTFAGSANSTIDYELPTTEAIYLVNIAVVATTDTTDISSLTTNIYGEEFIEFFGDNNVVPGSIGKTEINPDYKAERAVNNYIIPIDDHVVVDGVMMFSPAVTTQLDMGTIYYIYFTATSTPTKVSLGYYDDVQSSFVPYGKEYNITIDGTITNKVCIAILNNNTMSIRALV